MWVSNSIFLETIYGFRIKLLFYNGDFTLPIKVSLLSSFKSKQRSNWEEKSINRALLLLLALSRIWPVDPAFYIWLLFRTTFFHFPGHFPLPIAQSSFLFFFTMPSIMWLNSQVSARWRAYVNLKRDHKSESSPSKLTLFKPIYTFFHQLWH